MNVPCGLSAGLPVGMQLVGVALQRVDDLPRRARLRAARRLAQLLTGGRAWSCGIRSARSGSAAAAPTGCGRTARCRTSSGPTDEPLRFLTIPQQLDKTVSRHGPRDAAIFDAEGVRLTWYDLKRAVRRAGRRPARARPAARQSRRHLGAEPRTSGCVTQFATARVGLVLVNINPAYRTTELEYALNKVGCRALVMARRYKSSDYLGMLGEIAPEIDFKGASEVARQRRACRA